MDKRIIKNSKLSNTRIRKVIDAFIKNAPAFEASLDLNINRHSVERIYKKIRIAIMISEGECIPKDFLNYEHPLGFNGTIPIIGIKNGHGNAPRIACRVIGMLQNNDYNKMPKNAKAYSRAYVENFEMTHYDKQVMEENDEINRKLYYNIRGIDAIAVGNFEFYKITYDPTRTIGKFMSIYRKMLKKYHSINWKYTNQYLQEALWRSRMHNFRNPQEVIVKLLKKYRDSSYLS